MSCLIDPGSTNYCSILDVSQKHTLYFVLVLGLRGSASLAYPHSSHIQESKKVTGKGQHRTRKSIQIGRACPRFPTEPCLGRPRNPSNVLSFQTPKHYQKRGFRAHTSNFPEQFLLKIRSKTSLLASRKEIPIGIPIEMGANALQDYIDQRLLR